MVASAFSKSSKEHENDNISITTKWILTKLWQNTQVSDIRPIWAFCFETIAAIGLTVGLNIQINEVMKLGTVTSFK